MHIPFTKMHGAGNDFIVLDETVRPLRLTARQYRALADRHFGIGADQILSVRPAPSADVDFEYVIHNADGSEVEHCGNGARCFLRYVRTHGLTDKKTVRVKVQRGTAVLEELPDGRISVDMGAPRFDPADLPMRVADLEGVIGCANWTLWKLDLRRNPHAAALNPAQAEATVAVLSMGNPHAVQIVRDLAQIPIEKIGALIETHPAFPQRVNAGFLQIVDRRHAKLRVYERGAGETLACGTGACAAAVAAIRLDKADSPLDLEVRGGTLTVEWSGGLEDNVTLIGPAIEVFRGSIDFDTLPKD